MLLLVRLASFLRTGWPFHWLHQRARSYVTEYASLPLAMLVRQRQTQQVCSGASCSRSAWHGPPGANASQTSLNTLNNGVCCVAIDVHGFKNLHQHPNTANPTCSWLAAIFNMTVKSILLVTVTPPQQCFGAIYEPLFLVRSWCFGCRKTDLKLGSGSEPALKLHWWKSGICCHLSPYF